MQPRGHVLRWQGGPTARDDSVAARLLTLAADQGCQPARDFLGKLTALCPAGARVRVVGLVAAAAHLNGRLGTAVKPPMSLATGQIAVRIDGQTKSTSVSWANVRPLGWHHQCRTLNPQKHGARCFRFPS